MRKLLLIILLVLISFSMANAGFISKGKKKESGAAPPAAGLNLGAYGSLNLGAYQ